MWKGPPAPERGFPAPAWPASRARRAPPGRPDPMEAVVDRAARLRVRRAGRRRQGGEHDERGAKAGHGHAIVSGVRPHEALSRTMSALRMRMRRCETRPRSRSGRSARGCDERRRPRWPPRRRSRRAAAARRGRWSPSSAPPPLKTSGTRTPSGGGPRHHWPKVGTGLPKVALGAPDGRPEPPAPTDSRIAGRGGAAPSPPSHPVPRGRPRGWWSSAGRAGCRGWR